MVKIETFLRHPEVSQPDTRWEIALQRIFQEHEFSQGQVNLVIVDDPTIAELNQTYLSHTGPTDVLSFPLACESPLLEGEIVASFDTARRAAPQYGGEAEDELLLYLVHGGLHLVGYDDQDPDERRRMRQREREVLSWFGKDYLDAEAPTKTYTPWTAPET